MTDMRLKLLEKRDEAKGTKTFLFEKPDDFTYLAGQYIYLTLDKLNYPDERGVTRHFTLSSSPTEDHLSITTRVRPESGFKRTLDELEMDSKVSMRGPNGNFTLEDEHTELQQVFIAGGIGITPFRSILRYVIDSGLTTPIHLIYSNSIPEEITFKAEIDQITANHQNIIVDYTITKPEESQQPWVGRTGRIDSGLISQLSTHYLSPKFWVCGPPAMVDGIEQVLQELQIPQERVKSDKFTGY